MKATPLSPYSIALRIGRTHKGVQDTIRRLKLRPVLQLEFRCYYHPDAVDAVRAAMRKPNRSKEA